MAGLVPATHAKQLRNQRKAPAIDGFVPGWRRLSFGVTPNFYDAAAHVGVDGRDKPGQDVAGARRICAFDSGGEGLPRPHTACAYLSACSRSTETSCEMPRSACVTPNRRSMRAIVMGLCVMATKRVSVFLRISSSRAQKRSTL